MTLEEKLDEVAENTLKGMEIANDIVEKVRPSMHIHDMTALVVTMSPSGEYSFCASMDSGEAIAVLRKVIAELEKEQN